MKCMSYKEAMAYYCLLMCYGVLGEERRYSSFEKEKREGV